ncbi:MAG: CPBP family intramembrane metalloprotease [Clostridiales bacterium]|mgnify:CR=1 FL=1|jgi:membrane protease YdiL (CAAX protease family)|nr:CPBP family intramembrane metalloprotease [Clostridiales bacterium]
MGSIKKVSLLAMIAMVILSFTNLFGIPISSLCIFIGLAFFFINNTLAKQPTKGSGLDLGAISNNLKDRRIWIWILLPILVNAACVTLSLLFIPEYIEFETARAGQFVSVEISLSSILLFFVFALGEEIAWRAFFQQQLNKALPLVPVLIISSLLFTLGHFQSGPIRVVLFGLTFTFINSCLYGVIFHKTQNAWISTIAHYAANMFEVLLYVLIR